MPELKRSQSNRQMLKEDQWHMKPLHFFFWKMYQCLHLSLNSIPIYIFCQCLLFSNNLSLLCLVSLNRSRAQDICYWKNKVLANLQTWGQAHNPLNCNLHDTVHFTGKKVFFIPYFPVQCTNIKYFNKCSQVQPLYRKKSDWDWDQRNH